MLIYQTVAYYSLVIDMAKTTIQVSAELKEELAKRKFCARETFEEVIRRLIKEKRAQEAETNV